MSKIVMQSPKVELEYLLGNLTKRTDSQLETFTHGQLPSDFIEKAKALEKLGKDMWSQKFSDDALDMVRRTCGGDISEREHSIRTWGRSVDVKALHDDLVRFFAVQNAGIKNYSYGSDAFYNFRAAFVQKLIDKGVADKGLILMGVQASIAGENRYLAYLRYELHLQSKHGIDTRNIRSQMEEISATIEIIKAKAEDLKAAKSDEEIIRLSLPGRKGEELHQILRSFGMRKAELQIRRD